MDEQHNHNHHMAVDRHSSRSDSSSSDDGCENGDAITNDYGEYRGDEEILSKLQESQEEQHSQGSQQQHKTKRDKPEPACSKEKYNLNRRHGTCPRCGGELVERDGPYGAFYGCSAYPRCTYTRDKKHGMTKGRSRPKIGYTAMNRYRRGPKL